MVKKKKKTPLCPVSNTGLAWWRTPCYNCRWISPHWIPRHLSLQPWRTTRKHWWKLRLSSHCQRRPFSRKVFSDMVTDVPHMFNKETTLRSVFLSLIYCDLLFTDADKFEVELTSDLNSDIHKLIPGLEDYNEQLQRLFDDVLDQRVPKTDMKLRHIINKGIEVKTLDDLMPWFPKLFWPQQPLLCSQQGWHIPTFPTPTQQHTHTVYEAWI